MRTAVPGHDIRDGMLSPPSLGHNLQVRYYREALSTFKIAAKLVRVFRLFDRHNPQQILFISALPTSCILPHGLEAARRRWSEGEAK